MRGVQSYGFSSRKKKVTILVFTTQSLSSSSGNAFFLHFQNIKPKPQVTGETCRPKWRLCLCPDWQMMCCAPCVRVCVRARLSSVCIFVPRPSPSPPA